MSSLAIVTGDSTGDFKISSGKIITGGKELKANPTSARITDLKRLLESKELWGSKDYVKNYTSLYRAKEGKGCDIKDLPTYDQNNTVLISHTTKDESGETEFLKIYEDVMNIKDNEVTIGTTKVDTSIEKYYNLVSMFDPINSYRVIDLVTMYGTEYTNILNLGKFFVNQSNSIELTVELGVATSKDGAPVGSEELVFGLQENSPDSRYDLSNSSIVEVSGKCVRVFPASTDVNECIITNCTIVIREKNG